MESIAMMFVFEERATKILSQEDLAGLDALVMQATYANRDPEWIKDYPETKAVNVLTYIDQFDKAAAGFRRHYDMLSERCHPNSFGHNFMFGTLDRTDGTVRFCEERDPKHNKRMVLAALAPLPLVESIMDRLDKLILDISELQHRLEPVGGSSRPIPTA